MALGFLPCACLGQAGFVEAHCTLPGYFGFHIAAFVQQPHCPDEETEALQEENGALRGMVAEPGLQPRTPEPWLSCACVCGGGDLSLGPPVPHWSTKLSQASALLHLPWLLPVVPSWLSSNRQTPVNFGVPGAIPPVGPFTWLPWAQPSLQLLGPHDKPGQLKVLPVELALMCCVCHVCLP